MFSINEFSLKAQQLEPGNVYCSVCGEVFYLIEMQVVEGKIGIVYYPRKNGLPHLRAIRLQRTRIEKDEIWPPDTQRRFKKLNQ
jgi:hypothetical protein